MKNLTQNTNSVIKILVMALFLFFSQIGVVQATTIGFSPGSPTVSLGETFSIDVIVTDVVDLVGFGFDINFDNTIVDVLGVTEGDFFGGPTNWFSPGSVSGNSIFGIFNALDTLGSVSGTGILATIEFESIALGTFSLEVADNAGSPELINSNLGLISVDRESAIINVTNNNIPEPSAFWLLFLGLTMIGLKTYKKTII